MNRFVALQIVFNLVILANLLYFQRALRLARRIAAVPKAHAAPDVKPSVAAAPKVKTERHPGGFLLTLGLRGEARRDEPLLGLAALVDDAERLDSVPAGRDALTTPGMSEAPVDERRQRAADDLRRSIRRLQERIDAGEMPASQRTGTGNA
jgi:hypothetical protein